MDIVADVVATELASSVFDKVPGINRPTPSTSNPAPLSKRPSLRLLWRNSYGPSFDEELNPPPLDDENTSDGVSLTSELSSSDLYKAPAEGSFYLPLWYTMVPGSLIVICLTLLPYFPPTSGIKNNMLFHCIFSLILPFTYTLTAEYCFSRWFNIKKTFHRLWLQATISALITFTLTYTISRTQNTYPLKLSLIYFFTICVFVNVFFWGSSLHRAYIQGKKSRIFKTKWALAMSVALLMGWCLATGTLQIYAHSNAIVQSLIMAFIAVWKSLVTAMVKYLSLLVSQHGERFECLDVASITVCVHWFWTLFSNLAFAQVEEWWTMCLYLFLDLLSTMSFLVLCTERFAGLELVRLPPGAGTKWAGRWSFANVPQTKENKASRRYSVLYNSFSFLLVSYGEIAFAVYTLVVFVACRYGPNSQYSAVGEGSLSVPMFRRLVWFLLTVILVELVTLTLFVRLSPKYLGFDVTTYADEFMKKNWIILALMPALLHFPVASLMFEHSGMGFVVVGD